MITRIQAVHFDASQQLQEFIEKKVSKLEKLCDESATLEVSMKLIKPETAMNKEVSLSLGGIFVSKVADKFEDALLECIDALKVKIEKNKEIHKYIKEILTIKQKQWAYEDEYRLIIDLEDKFLFKVKVCKKGFSIKFPYYQCVYGYDIPKDSKKYKALVSIGKKNNVLLGNLILSSQERALVIDQNSFLEECVGWYKSNHYFNS